MPQTCQHIHLVAACGTGMGTLACILKEMGYKVTGSDQNVYPPMSDFLEASGIRLYPGYDRANIPEGKGAPDLVIIGNAISKDNPEAREVMERNIPYMSMPQAVNRLLPMTKKLSWSQGPTERPPRLPSWPICLKPQGFPPPSWSGGF